MGMDDQRADIIERNAPFLLARRAHGEEAAQRRKMQAIRADIDHTLHDAESVYASCGAPKRKPLLSLTGLAAPPARRAVARAGIELPARFIDADLARLDIT